MEENPIITVVVKKKKWAILKHVAKRKENGKFQVGKFKSSAPGGLFLI